MSYIRMSLKGHRLIRSTSGVEDTYQRGTCECGGWTYGGWTESREAVTRAHNIHVESERAKVLPEWTVRIGGTGEEVVNAATASAAALLGFNQWLGHAGVKAREVRLDGEGDTDYRIRGFRVVVTKH